jgi:hypothetical protein
VGVGDGHPPGVAGHHVTLVERNGDLGGSSPPGTSTASLRHRVRRCLTPPAGRSTTLAIAARRSPSRPSTSVGLDPSCGTRGPRARGAPSSTTGRASGGGQAETSAIPAGAAALRRPGSSTPADLGGADRSFFAGPLESPLALARRMQRPGDLLAIDPLRSLAGPGRADLRRTPGSCSGPGGTRPTRVVAGARTGHPRLQSLDRAGFGAWYVRGGLAVLAEALGKARPRSGSNVRTGVDVTAIRSGHERRQGRWRLAGGGPVDADVVVATSNATHIYATSPRRLMLKIHSGRRCRPPGFALLPACRDPGGRKGACPPRDHLLGRRPRGVGVRPLFRHRTHRRDPTIYTAHHRPPTPSPLRWARRPGSSS